MGVLVNDKINLETHTVAIHIDWGTPEYWRLMENSHWPKEAFSKAEMTDVCKSIDFGIPVGLSYEYKNIVLDARYNIGVVKFAEHLDYRNRVFQITLGYKFRL